MGQEVRKMGKKVKKIDESEKTINHANLSAQKKYLYHGSNKKLKLLMPSTPSDPKKQNSLNAVYATDNKDYALAMALTNQKNSTSFVTFNPLKMHFVRGSPKMKSVYLPYLPAKSFKKNALHQFISFSLIQTLKIEKHSIYELSHLWTKSTRKELKLFLKNRK